MVNNKIKLNTPISGYLTELNTLNYTSGSDYLRIVCVSNYIQSTNAQMIST